MLWIFRRRASVGGRDLAEELCLNGIRARFTQGAALRDRFQPGDRLIFWGDSAENLPRQVPEGTLMLNAAPLRSKYADAVALRAAGVPTVEVSQQRPAAVPARKAPFRFPNGMIGVDGDQEAVALIRQLEGYVATAPPQAATWLPRQNNHIGGGDLLNPPQRPDYYSKKEDLVEEYRLHMFLGKSIRAGRKIPRENAHQWVRSFDAGWIIAYQDFRSTEQMREIAANAIRGLSLDFGAVDLGQKRDGSLIVLEVNRAPGIEDGTVLSYVNAIKGWIDPASVQGRRQRRAA